MRWTEKYRQKAHEARRHTSGFWHYAFLLAFLLLQIGVLILLMNFVGYLPHYYLLANFVSICLVLYIVRSDLGSSYKVPWIILILLFPILGALSYTMFAHVRFSGSERRRMEEAQFRYAAAVFEKPDASGELAQEWAELLPQSRYILSSAASPVYRNTAVRYFSSGEAMYEQILAELRKAERFVFLEFFILHSGNMWNAVEKILIEKARQGVDVRILYDDIGSVGLVPHDYPEILKRSGIRAYAFNKLTNVFSSRFNNRDHRKILVVDGNVAFTGGINMADEYINAVERFGHWKDTGVLLRGEAVRSMTAVFLSNWDYVDQSATDFRAFMPTLSVPSVGFVQPFADSPYDGEMVGEGVYRNMLSRARRYVYITTPYLVINDELVAALGGAAKCGVDVRIITPGIPDKRITYTLTRSYYDVLLRSGVRIFEYSPGFMHAKQFISDDSCAVIGTINLDYRSLCHHFENAVWMCGCAAVLDAKRDFLDTLTRCREVTLESQNTRSIIKRLFQAALRLIAPLF